MASFHLTSFNGATRLHELEGSSDSDMTHASSLKSTASKRRRYRKPTGYSTKEHIALTKQALEEADAATRMVVVLDDGDMVTKTSSMNSTASSGRIRTRKPTGYVSKEQATEARLALAAAANEDPKASSRVTSFDSATEFHESDSDDMPHNNFGMTHTSSLNSTGSGRRRYRKPTGYSTKEHIALTKQALEEADAASRRVVVHHDGDMVTNTSSMNSTALSERIRTRKPTGYVSKEQAAEARLALAAAARPMASSRLTSFDSPTEFHDLEGNDMLHNDSAMTHTSSLNSTGSGRRRYRKPTGYSTKEHIALTKQALEEADATSRMVVVHGDGDMMTKASSVNSTASSERIRTRKPTGYVSKTQAAEASMSLAAAAQPITSFDSTDEFHELDANDMLQSDTDMTHTSSLNSAGSKRLRYRKPTGYSTKEHLALTKQALEEADAASRRVVVHDDCDMVTKTSSMNSTASSDRIRTRRPTGYVSKEQVAEARLALAAATHEEATHSENGCVQRFSGAH